MEEAQYFEMFALPNKVKITQNVHEKIEAARLWSLDKGVDRVEIEMFYLTSDCNGSIIEDLLVTEQSAKIAKTITEGDSYLKAVTELESLNRQRSESGLPQFYLIGHHHFHPGSIEANVSDFPPFRSSDDEKVYSLVTARAYGAVDRVVCLPYALFENQPDYNREGQVQMMHGKSPFDPQVSLSLPPSLEKLASNLASDHAAARELMSSIKINCNNRYGFAFFTIMNLSGGRPYCALGFMSRNLVFETQQYRVFDLSQEIEIIPSFSIDKAAFILELEQKVKLGQPDDEQEETLSKRLSDYLRTLLGRKDVDYLSMMSQGSSVVPLFQASQELTARELLGELDLFFTVLGEKGIQSHPALTIFAELYEGLSAMRRLSTYNEQQAFLRMFLSRFSKGYEQFLSRLGDDRGSTGSCTNAGKDNCSKDDASKSRDGKDDTPQQT